MKSLKKLIQESSFKKEMFAWEDADTVSILDKDSAKWGKLDYYKFILKKLKIPFNNDDLKLTIPRKYYGLASKYLKIEEVFSDIDEPTKIVEASYSVLKHITEKDVDPEQLKMGIEIEMEHTDDPKLASKIALDHLSEIPTYYSRLKNMEKQAEEDGDKDMSLSEDWDPYNYKDYKDRQRANSNWMKSMSNENTFYLVDLTQNKIIDKKKMINKEAILSNYDFKTKNINKKWMIWDDAQKYSKSFQSKIYNR